jgi:hypothetical protein
MKIIRELSDEQGYDRTGIRPDCTSLVEKTGRLPRGSIPVKGRRDDNRPGRLSFTGGTALSGAPLGRFFMFRHRQATQAAYLKEKQEALTCTRK